MVSLARATPVAFVLTRDPARAKVFYSNVLGLHTRSEDDFATTYDLHGTPLRLTTVADHQASPHTVIGWMVQDIAATSRALANKGVAFNIYPGFGQDDLGIWTAPDGRLKVNWFNDPDGNVLSLTEA